jgi:hypothetical protein
MSLITKIEKTKRGANFLFRQEDKDFNQVKMWPPTQQLVIKSIVLNFGL